ncbi:unnamed protein product [Pseudo-nitzschia multistriata]|uniref:Uncharacterized protein n=1 Tax=Pseudo-nitzschia multistriata TaxID=183589 RepID=A0A448ZMI2_9STRA|nr:unnamed protein product [Pseudo-nitzschia multistriata]
MRAAFVPLVLRTNQWQSPGHRTTNGRLPFRTRSVGAHRRAFATARRSATATKASDSNNDDGPPTTDSSPDDTIIPEKIRWIFEEADGDFLDDEDDDDSFFDDLFLTDDEEYDDYDDTGGFLVDDSDEDGPGAGLSEDDLMELHDVYADTSLPRDPAEAPPPATEPMASGSPIPPGAEESIAASTVAAAAQTSGKTTNAVSMENILASLESDLSYFYLRDELGITEDTMWKITNDAPSVLGFKANNVRNKVKVLQSLVGLTDDEIRQLITLQPTLLQLSAKKNLAPTILYWIRRLEIGKEELRTLILGCPNLLKFSRANIHRKLVFFQTTMGYTVSECRKILLKDPRLLTCSVKTGLIPRLRFLHKEVEISLPDIRKIALKNPSILRMSVEQNLTPKCIFYFILTLHMENKDVAKMLLKYPRILNYNLEHHILPIHHYFLSLEFSTYEFSYILQRYPRLITYSLMRIKRRIGYLRYELSLEAKAVRRILHYCPQIISLGQDNLEETIGFLLNAVAPGATLSATTTSTSTSESGRRSFSGSDSPADELVETDDRDALAIVQILVTSLPTLVALSIENNLSPKVDYLREKLGQEELSGALLRMPALLGYSLEKRIRPRLERLEECGIPLGTITQAITLRQDLYEEWVEKRVRKQAKQREQPAKQRKPRGLARKKTKTAAATRARKRSTVSKRKPAEGVPPAVSAAAGSASDVDVDVDNNNNNNDHDNDTKSRATAKGESTDGKNTATTEGGRVVEDGGKIIHWRRR